MTYPRILFFLVLLAEIALGIQPQADRTTWVLENFPVFIILPLTVYLQPRLKLSYFALTMMALHALVLMLGGFYTYAKVPLGFWMQEWFHFQRNHYDRIGHLMQGFVPAIVFREMFLSKTTLKRGAVLTTVLISMSLAIACLYEIIEWISAVALGQGADAFLGTQGDPWDTQEDMFCALLGVLFAVWVAVKIQDRLTKPLLGRGA